MAKDFGQDGKRAASQSKASRACVAHVVDPTPEVWQFSPDLSNGSFVGFLQSGPGAIHFDGRKYPCARKGQPTSEDLVRGLGHLQLSMGILRFALGSGLPDRKLPSLQVHMRLLERQ